MHLLYPSNPLRSKQPDEQYAPEVEAARSAGFEVSLFSMEDFQSGYFRAIPPLTNRDEILYRGWMLSAKEYETLCGEIVRSGAKAAIQLNEYLGNHYLPNWYGLIANLTPETRIFPPDCDLGTELQKLGWPEFFIKDYVKSLKTSGGSRITKPEQVAELVENMRRFRGTVEGGFCVRRIENFLPDTERRYFVLDGKPHAEPGEAPVIVNECARLVRGRFYSVDVVQRADGQSRVVEIGDGQVSDLVGWSPERFIRALAEHFLKPAS